MEKRVADLNGYNCATCKFYNAKRKYYKSGNSDSFYVEQTGVCSNSRSKKYNSSVGCFERNTSCHRIASDVEAILNRRKLDEESKRNILQQDRNANLINADSYRIRKELEKQREERERAEREKLEKQIAKEEARKISEVLEKMDPLDRAIFEGKNRRSLYGSIYNLDLSKYRITSSQVESKLKEEKTKFLKENNKNQIVMIGLVVFLLICFGLTWIPFNNFEIEKMNSSYLDGIPNPYWVFPVMMAIVIAIILILTSLALVFNKRKRQAKIKEIENKLEQTKKYEEKNGETLNDSKGFNQLKLCVKTIDEFGPFIDELRKDGKKITILDKEKIIEKLEDLYIVPVYFVTFLRLLCFSNKNLSKDEAAVIIDAMYDSRISLYREDEELKKIIDKRRETLPDDAHQLSVYINDLSEKHKDDFEEILILSRIFFEKNYTFSGE